MSATSTPSPSASRPPLPLPGGEDRAHVLVGFAACAMSGFAMGIIATLLIV